MIKINKVKDSTIYFNFTKNTNHITLKAILDGSIIGTLDIDEASTNLEYWWSPDGNSVGYNILVYQNGQQVRFVPIKKRIAVISSYTDINKFTNTGESDYVIPSTINHTEYCFKHNYSYIRDVYREDQYKGYHPTWIKILSLLKHIQGYDYVVWIDSDCVFINKEKKIEDLILEDVNLIISKEEFDRKHNTSWTSVSTGFMVFKNSQQSINILETLLEYEGKYKTDYFHEQSVLDDYLRDKGYYQIEELYNQTERDLKTITFIKDVGFLPYSYQKHYEFDNTEFIYHASGSSNTKRERIEKSLGVI